MMIKTVNTTLMFEKSKLRKEVKEIYKYSLLFDMDRLEFLKNLVRLEIEVDKKGWIKESKEYKELIKYRLMDTRYMIRKSGFDGYFSEVTNINKTMDTTPSNSILDNYFTEQINFLPSEVTDINETNE